MPRRLTRRQRAQNAAFLRALARTGNARLAARELGLNRSTLTRRRAKHPAFAAEWDAALQSAQAYLEASPNPPPDVRGRGTARRAVEGPEAKRSENSPRTQPPAPKIIRLGGGRLQLRRTLPGAIDARAEGVFLAALAATNNVRHAAAAAGFAHTSFLAHARRSPAFAAAMAQALAEAPARAERAARRATEAAGRAALASLPDQWPAGMTVDEALHTLRSPPLRPPATF